MLEEKDIYNKKDIYMQNMEPLIQKLKLECNVHQMPMFVTVAVANSEEGTEFINDMVYSSTGITLAEKKLGAILLLLNNFDVQMPDHIKRCTRDLEQYLEKLQIAKKKGTPLEVHLADDKIQKINGVMHGDDRVFPPKAVTTSGETGNIGLD